MLSSLLELRYSCWKCCPRSLPCQGLAWLEVRYLKMCSAPQDAVLLQNLLPFSSVAFCMCGTEKAEGEQNRDEEGCSSKPLSLILALWLNPASLLLLRKGWRLCSSSCGTRGDGTKECKLGTCQHTGAGKVLQRRWSSPAFAAAACGRSAPHGSFAHGWASAGVSLLQSGALECLF